MSLRNQSMDNNDNISSPTRNFLSREEEQSVLRQREEEVRRLKSQLERYRGLLKASSGSASSDSTAQQHKEVIEENAALQAQLSQLQSKRAEEQSKLEMMARRVESLERDAKNSTRNSWNSNNKSYTQKNNAVVNGLHQDTPPDPMVLDKLHMRIEALERELEKERHTTTLLKEDKEQLKSAVTDLQLRENERLQNGTSGSSSVTTASMAAEISQLKSALDSARKERQVLEEDRERERKMFMENNARGESTRMEMMELRKNFDDMQAAVLQLQHELKLRNESIADLQQQLIFFQNLDKKRSSESNKHGQKSTVKVTSVGAGGGESPVYECSRCHQYFKDMPEFQEHITKCLEFRLFHSNNRRSKSVEPLTQDSSQTELHREKPSPFPSSNLNSTSGPNSQSSAILTKYSYDNLRSAGLTNSSSQLKITAIDSRHESRSEDRNRANSLAGGVNSKLNRRVGGPQKGGNQVNVYDPDRSRAVSTPHLPSHQKQNSIESSSVGGFESDYSYNSGNNLNVSTEPELENEDTIEPTKVAVKELPELQASSGGKVMSYNSRNEPFDDLIQPEVSLSVSAPKSMSSPIAQMVSKNQFNEQRNFNPNQNHDRQNSYGRNNNADRNFNQSHNYPASHHEREGSYGRGSNDPRSNKNQSFPVPMHEKQNSYGQQNKEMQDNPRLPIRGKSSGFSVTRMKSPEEQPAPEIFKISSNELNSSNPQQRPLDVRPDSTSLEISDNNMLAKTRHSPTISSSSSDGVREASINLRAEMRTSRDEPDSFNMRNSLQQGGVGSGGYREAVLSPTPAQPSLERNPREDLLSPVQRERIPREDLTSPGKNESDMELVYENAANAARQKFLEASKPGLALQEKLGDRGHFRRPPPPNAQRSSLPPDGTKPAWERQPLQRPGFVPIQQPNRLSASSDMRSPTNDAVLEHPVANQPGRDNHPMRQPLGPGRRSEPFGNDDTGPRNGFVSDESVPFQPDVSNNRNSLMSPTVPNHQQSKSDAERNPAFNFNEESLKSPVSRRSITFDPKEKPKNPKSRNPTTGPPNSILRNASKGIQVIDNTGSDGEALEVGAEISVGIGGRDQGNQNFESDSNSSVKYHPDKENSNSLGRPKKNERSKSPSLKNFRNRFFSNSDDKKEKEKDKDKNKTKKLQDKKGSRQPMVPQQPPVQVPPQSRDDFQDDANYPRRESEGEFRGRAGNGNNGSYRGRPVESQQQNPPRQGPMRAYDRPQFEREGMGRESDGGGGRGDGNRGRSSMQSQPQYRPQFSAEMRQGMPTSTMQYRGGPRAKSQPPAQHNPSVGRGEGGNGTLKQQSNVTVSTDV